MRLTLIPLLLFILPAAYVDTHVTLWTTRLTVASHRQSPQEASVIIRGLSVPLSTPAPPVAVCITQESLAIPAASVYRSIDQYIVQVLKDAGYSVHVFLHLAEAHASTPSLQQLLHILHPISVTFHSKQDACRLTHCAKSRVACPSALLHAQQCYDYVKAHEQHTDTRFDWVYKTRLDIALGDNITTPNLHSSDTVYTSQNHPNSTIHTHTALRNMFPDHANLLSGAPSHYLFAVSRRWAETVFNSVDAFRECALFDIPMRAATDEIGFLYWLVSRGIRYETPSWFWMLVDNTSSPDCSRVRWIRSQGGRHDSSLTRRCLSYKQLIMN